jgi:hypothetical protein
MGTWKVDGSTIEHVFREHNTAADALASDAVAVRNGFFAQPPKLVKFSFITSIEQWTKRPYVSHIGTAKVRKLLTIRS